MAGLIKRTRQLLQVERIVKDSERRRAERLALSERRVSECEAKLKELESYQASYTREFTARAGAGMVGAGLRDFQTFLARLAEAIRQQSQLLVSARADRDAERSSWQGEAQRAAALGKLVKRRQSEDQRALEQREQRESDERSQHARGHLGTRSHDS